MRAARAASGRDEGHGRALDRLIVEATRLWWLRGLEDRLEGLGFRRVAGVDEAGRGCLAGPVVAAAVVPSSEPPLFGVDDSKALAPERRRVLAEAIRASARGVAVTAVAPDDIDRINILEATRVAMRRALASLAPPADCAIVDAVSLPGAAIPCLALVRGDCIAYAVACASIVAKVERDRLMDELDERFPHYGFARHKGYGAPDHLEALERYGPSPVHRLSFRSVVPRAT